MAKRRKKTKAKRHFAGLDRKVKINGEIVEKMMKIETKTKLETESECIEVDDLGGKVQITESSILPNSAAENKNNLQNTCEIDIKKMPKRRGRKPNKNKHRKKQNSDGYEKKTYGNVTTDEELIYPKEIDGETCIEIKCGNNDAQLYLSKLSVGSKGACIYYSDSWLTPNEFQSVSGRETAKDWKRSIRHKGRSLKMLISKGLITVQSVFPKQLQEKPSQKSQEKPSQKSQEKPSQKNQDQHKALEDTSVLEEKATQEKRDDTNSAAGVREITSELKPDTKQIPKKRGRKPKRLRQRNALAKAKAGKASATKVTPLQVAEIPETTQSGDIKAESQINEEYRPANQDEEETKSTEDTQAEEERRLDEFVKSLRLTKAIAAPKSAPELPTIENVKDEPENTGDDDPEMPVLQKEADILPEPPSTHENNHINISVNVDTFHATVTPPPTPPADKIMIERKTDDEKLDETYKSRLTSPGNGTKLTISRDKVNIDDIDKSSSVMKLPYDAGTECKLNKPNMQTLLLQDALQSAKKYKEQLKQNMQTLSPKPIIRVPNVKCKSEDFKAMESSLPRSGSSSGIQKVYANQRQQPVEKPIERNKQNRYEHHNRRQVPHAKTQSLNGLFSGMPTSDDMKNLAGMSFQEILAGMSSIYGPPPFPVDSKDATFVALQEMQRRHEMLRLIAQGQVDGSSSPILYPMMTQQILLAMTQQLYSMYNMPGVLPSMKTSSSPKSQTAEIQQPSISEFHHRQPAQIPETQHRRMLQTQDTRPRKTSTLPHEIPYRRTMQPQEFNNRRQSLQKRKHPEHVTDCAIDLSVKRNKIDIDKTENTASAEPKSLCDVNSYDVPLDFSMKKTNYPEQCHNKRTDNDKLNSSFNMFQKIDYKRQTPAFVHVPESNSKICTCDRTRDEDITSWSVERVCYFLRDLDGCAQYAKTFHDQGISGRLLPYLTTQHLTRTLGMKVGPALTLIQAVERRFRERHSALSAPHHACVIHQPFTMPVHIP